MSIPCPVLAFHVRATFDPAALPAEVAGVIKSLGRLLDAHGLEASGLGPPPEGKRLERSHCIVRREGAQATDADRRLVIAWAAGWSSTASIEVSEIVDLSEAS